MDLDAATKSWHCFSAGLRAHADAEDGLVLRRFEMVAPPTVVEKMSLVARDHRIIEGTLSEVDALMEHLQASPSSDRRRIMVENFGALMRLRGALEHHGKRETESLYPVLDRKLDEGQIEELCAVLIAPSEGAPPNQARRANTIDAAMPGVVEPFRIVRCEPVPELTWHERRVLLDRAGSWTASLAEEHATIDLFAPSNHRSSRPMPIARGWRDHGPAIRSLTGCPVIFETPATHGPHDMLTELFCRPDDVVLGNGLPESMLTALAARGASAHDILACRDTSLSDPHPFRGDIDLELLEEWVARGTPRVPFVLVSVISSHGGGQPIAPANVAAASQICRKHGSRLFIDLTHSVAAATLARQQAPSLGFDSVAKFVHAICAPTDGCVWARSPFGGPTFLAVFDEQVLPADGSIVLREQEAATSEPVETVTDPETLVRAPLATYGVRSVARAASRLRALGVPVLWPPGAHSVIIDAARFAGHLVPEQYPAVALSAELFLRGGVRTPIIMAGYPEPCVQLPLGQRLLTRMQIDYVIDVVADMHQQAGHLGGYIRESEEPLTFRPVQDGSSGS